MNHPRLIQSQMFEIEVLELVIRRTRHNHILEINLAYRASPVLVQCPHADHAHRTHIPVVAGSNHKMRNGLGADQATGTVQIRDNIQVSLWRHPCLLYTSPSPRDS
eukprot:TRINITY_DN25357_c0_g1_i1.p1 TRINITY_DN25357_c0_g1~~TRINITY_DN25357_c0_g1_i1.p1  ORF type:complete len:106 (+),score=11.20 TRINITY_DN25357_c0_g1_i1:148-465(+)